MQQQTWGWVLQLPPPPAPGGLSPSGVPRVSTTTPPPLSHQCGGELNPYELWSRVPGGLRGNLCNKKHGGGGLKMGPPGKGLSFCSAQYCPVVAGCTLNHKRPSFQELHDDETDSAKRPERDGECQAGEGGGGGSGFYSAARAPLYLLEQTLAAGWGQVHPPHTASGSSASRQATNCELLISQQA